jgi:hypothetical protein
VAIDLDGVLDEDPAMFASMMTALRAAGHKVSVVTGCSSKKPSQTDIDEKSQLLSTLGMGHAYDQLVVIGDPPHKAKAKWCKQNKVDALIDNDVQNANRASKYCTVLVPWNSLIPPEDKTNTKLGLDKD